MAKILSVKVSYHQFFMLFSSIYLLLSLIPFLPLAILRVGKITPSRLIPGVIFIGTILCKIMSLTEICVILPLYQTDAKKMRNECEINANYA